MLAVGADTVKVFPIERADGRPISPLTGNTRMNVDDRALGVCQLCAGYCLSVNHGLNNARTAHLLVLSANIHAVSPRAWISPRVLVRSQGAVHRTSSKLLAADTAPVDVSRSLPLDPGGTT